MKKILIVLILIQILYGNTLEQACHGGNVKSCLRLGLDFYKSGKYSKAIPLMEKSCNGKIGPACGIAAVLYREGKGVDVDLDKAIFYFQKACDLHYTKVCPDLSNVYRKKGMNKKAFDVDKQSCDMKKAKGSCYNVAQDYLKGKYVENNATLAERYFELSCKYGAKAGCIKYNFLHIEKHINAKLEPNKRVELPVAKCDKDGFKMPAYEGTMRYTYIHDENKTTQLATFEFGHKIPQEITLAVLDGKNCTVKGFETQKYIKTDGYKTVVDIGYKVSRIRSILSMFAKKTKNDLPIHSFCRISDDQKIKAYDGKSIVIYYDKKIKNDKISVLTKDGENHNFVLKFNQK